MGVHSTFVACEPSAFRVGEPIVLEGDFRLTASKPDSWPDWDYRQRADWLERHSNYRLLMSPKAEIDRDHRRFAEVDDPALKESAFERTCQPIYTRDWEGERLSFSPSLAARRRLERTRFAGRIAATHVSDGTSAGVLIEVATGDEVKWMRFRNWIASRGPRELMSVSFFVGLIATLLKFQTAILPTWAWVAALAFSAAGMGFARLRGARF